jgi:HlyD family secretion protein
MPEKSGGSSFKWIAGAVAVAALAAGIFFFQRGHGDAPTLNSVTVTRGDVTQNVTATGTLNPVKSVQVGCQVSGRISDIFVDFNSQVKAGDQIAQLDPRTYLAQVASADADLANATANMELQKAQAQRTADLFTNKLVSGSDFDTAIATLHQAEAVVKIKKAALENANTSLGYTKIFSPVDGTVISRSVDVGQTVAASFNTPTLFLIANDLTRMQIDAAVSEADVGGVIEGQSVDFTVDAYPNRTFHGEVTQVRNSPTTLNNVVTYDAVISVTNADYKLKPGMTANVSVIVAHREGVLKLPNAALRFRPTDSVTVLTNELVALAQPTNAPVVAAEKNPGQRGPRGEGHGPGRGQNSGKGARGVRTVYVLAGDEHSPALKPVQIRTGITDGIATEILEGLNENDKVVSSVVSNDAQAAPAASNPFGGGGFQRR